MEVKVKRLHPDAVIPTYAKSGDAGLDLTAVTRFFDVDGNVVYGSGLAFEIPQGYVGLVFPRSSLSKKDLNLANSVGVIDSGYRGEVTFKFRPNGCFCGKEEVSDNYDFACFIDKEDSRIYDIGERIGQIIILPYPQIAFVETDKLSATCRGEGGYGSTGK